MDYNPWHSFKNETLCPFIGKSFCNQIKSDVLANLAYWYRLDPLLNTRNHSFYTKFPWKNWLKFFYYKGFTFDNSNNFNALTFIDARLKFIVSTENQNWSLLKFCLFSYLVYQKKNKIIQPCKCQKVWCAFIRCK